MDRAIEYRSKCKHFRTLIIGRANAGKTTLLKKVCNSSEDPEIFSPSGEKLDPAVVQGSSERGIHDIKNELIFRSNPQFIFHDSRGFESGSLDEIETVKSFIAERAQSRELSEQLHAIWYCLPTDTNRPLLDADKSFFNEYGIGKVPVIAIFTKFDGLVSTAYGELREIENFSMEEAKNKKFERAQKKLETNFVEPLKASRPSAYVRLDDMRMEDSSCNELIEKTVNVLDDRLKLLFVSVQQNNIDICIEYAIRSGMNIRGGTDRLRDLIRASLAWFPHVWVGEAMVSGQEIPS
ncbi:hypothetical protein BJV78DRAFT_1280267 [Lactifluus subvellereus]|nr:hypothetical protein BJV78DRAFT_1280267 [Lactifluus subvellereus]